MTFKRTYQEIFLISPAIVFGRIFKREVCLVKFFYNKDLREHFHQSGRTRYMGCVFIGKDSAFCAAFICCFGLESSGNEE